MKRTSRSALAAGGEMPAEPTVLPALRGVEKQLSRPFVLPGSPGEQSPNFEAGLAHLARLAGLGEMLAGIVHEINQPLFAIQNYARALVADLTQNRPLDRDKLLVSTSQISLESDRAGAIISRLRDFARRAPPCAAHHDVCRLVREAVDLVLPEARRRKITIQIHCEEEVQTIYADRIQIQQVLTNLLRNACESIVSTGSDAGQIVVRARPEQESVEFRVSDTGAGLPPVDSKQLFEPFFTTKPDGVGIGLAVSRSIIERARGRLWAEPNTPRGAVFSFTVPTVPMAPNDSAPEATCEQ